MNARTEEGKLIPHPLIYINPKNADIVQPDN
jgi:hypothetical protein